MSQPSERAMRIAEEITRRTTCNHYRLVLNEERMPAITDSKIGGIPYWPADKPFPVDEHSEKMLMLRTGISPARTWHVAVVYQHQSR